jgi:AraC-like DNA-binding protein
MDALAGLLDGPRARQAFLLRIVLDPPWSMRIQDRAPLAVLAMVKGEAHVIPYDGPAVVLRPGDVAIARGPDEYVVADNPSTPPQVIIHPGERCTTLYGEDLAEAMDQGVRTWGNSADGSSVMLVGTYASTGEISDRLLRSLPTLLTVPADSWDSPIVPLLAHEVTKDDQGQSAVLDRLLDLLLIGALRVWFARPEVEAGWFQAQGDPVVGRALRMLHNHPAHPWTVGALAGRTGVSRAALARRFTELVGEPPMSYLTSWRLALAADLLREPDATLGAVARQVGYSSAFALSAAFKRVRGVSPQAFRAGASGAAGSAGSAGSVGSAGQEVVADPEPPAEYDGPAGRGTHGGGERGRERVGAAPAAH